MGTEGIKLVRESSAAKPQPDIEVARLRSRRGFFGALLAFGWALTGAFTGLPVVRYLLHCLRSPAYDFPMAEIGSVTECQSCNTPVRKLLRMHEVDGWRSTTTE